MLRKLAQQLFLVFGFLIGLAAAAEARKMQVAVATFSQSVLPFVVAED